MTTDNQKTVARWHSRRTELDMTMVRWGHFGKPVLVFPTAGGDAEEIERFLMIRVLQPLLDAGRIKVYSVDSVAARIWHDTSISWRHKTWLQNQFDGYIYNEVVPAIRKDCGDDSLRVTVAGASIGAFNAMASLCRHPDVFEKAICMSGSYDVERFIKGMDGQIDDHFYFSSPLHWLRRLSGGKQLDALRHCSVQMCHGGGRWEDPAQDWRMARLLGIKGVPNRVDPWGEGYDHDWPTWRAMLPKYLAEI